MRGENELAKKKAGYHKGVKTQERKRGERKKGYKKWDDSPNLWAKLDSSPRNDRLT